MKKTKVYEQVVELLDKNQPSKMTGVTPRDSDRELIIQFLQLMCGADLSIEQVEIIRNVNFESIRRARTKLQAEGKYPASPEIAKRRKTKGWELQQSAPSESAAGIQRRIEENQ